ncbi:HD domain-containing phosphohydrolase [Azonexus fungiphilus]|uniref:HD domain-containing phosphohydrolase n=1 Tax=Azonexus fungiphilus TaxID=146940 RepID=UPI001C2C1C2D|nr:HD domain-containing phosphohydrolase [Azonexus fungiphilus]
MPGRFQLRFQYWVLAALFVIILALTAGFLFTVFGRFQSMIEENARERFSLVAEHSIAATTMLIDEAVRIVGSRTGDARSLAPAEMLPELVGSLAVSSDIYGQYFGLPGNGFVQAIAVRGDPRLLAALQAPAATWFALRRIAPGGVQAHWQFLDRNRRLLAERLADNDYRATERPWFTAAMATPESVATAPYRFASTGELGLTLAQALPDGSAVFGLDIKLSRLRDFLAAQPLSENAAILLLDGDRRIIAGSLRGSLYQGGEIAALSRLDQLAEPTLQALAGRGDLSGAKLVELPQAGELRNFVVVGKLTEAFAGARFTVVALAPASDFSAPIERARSDVMAVSLALMVILVPLALLGSRRVVQALAVLARNSERLKRLDFTTEPQRPQSVLYEINALGEAQLVMQQSIRERTEALDLAQQKLRSLVGSGLMMSREKDRNALLRHILNSAQEISHCAAATLFLKTEHDTLRFALRTASDDLQDFEVPLHDPVSGAPMSGYVSSYVALNNTTVIIDDVYRETRFDLSGTMRFSEQTGLRTVSMLTIPLSPRTGEVIGVLQLMNALDPRSGEIVPFAPEIVSFVEALAAQSAVTLENVNLLEAQKELMDSLIRLIAGAIDAKSAYTGGHCERVPQLAMMLAEAACAVDSGPLADFRFASEEEWREFRIGAWLHDCGKVTTPEYVVDKATKLETIYNRIHEVRTRFEVLLRDAEIERLQAIHERGVAPAEADAALAARRAQLLDDFAFVAEANIGGEFMAPEKIERIRRIAGETWWRNFDDRLGLSQDEQRRRSGEAENPLPVRENLLADKSWHVVPREADNPALQHGWSMTVPENLYNFGEVYNLGIGRGTLTEEERFKINEHIIQTILMLEQLPLPKSLRRVPEYAGTHHETMTGSGYPRRLSAEQLSIPSRIMAVADIFEALTASDRPYKPMKTLSESIRILSFFKKDRHIDPVIFDLFLSSGVYRAYAERFLKPEQIDEVDIAAYLG